MPWLPALVAGHYISCLAFSCLVPNLIALEAHLFRAFEGKMALLPTQNASQLLSFVGALPGHVPELFAIPALYDGIVVIPIPLPNHLLHLIEIISWLLLFVRLLLLLSEIRISCSLQKAHFPYQNVWPLFR